MRQVLFTCSSVRPNLLTRVNEKGELRVNREDYEAAVSGHETMHHWRIVFSSCMATSLLIFCRML